MDLEFTAEDLTFRDEVRDFIKTNYPADTAAEVRQSRNGHVSKEKMVDWQKKLFQRGWIAPNWPKEYGGAGFTQPQKYIFEMEMAAAHGPYISPFGLKMVAPVIMRFGTDAQKKRFLPKILSSEEVWCQGYSEPGSGSDLASLKTRAIKQGDHYVVNGSKIWTTLAQYADWIFCLVRTSTEGKPQDGISFLLIDMKSPGIRIEPIITADGTRVANRHEVNQVFFTDVKVPVENLVGEENKGWTCAKYLLEFERGGAAYGPRLQSAYEGLRSLASGQHADSGETLMDDADFRDRMAMLGIEIEAVVANELRFFTTLKTGDAPGPMSSVVKLRGTEVIQKIGEMAVEALGYYADPFTDLRPVNSNVEPIGPLGADAVAPRYFNGRKVTIYGGSSEVQRNIMAKVVLGL
ncbi:MAG: acyl-CoA dehydrogenase family protein [Rhodospirillales bacterium]